MNLSRYTGKLNELRSQLREDVAAVKAKKDLTEDAKSREVAVLQREFRRSYNAERQVAEQKLGAEMQTARRRANPAVSGPGSDSQAELVSEMRRQRVQQELAAEWEGRGGGPTVQEYESALAAGDTERAEVMEIFGPANIREGDIRNEFSRKVEESRASRMTEDQRAALGELQELEQARYELGVALAMQSGAVQDEAGAAA